ncbi:hypothetical protein OX284_003250 [Flavobacterium sp. SUN046]|uniref:hypothetical protein n=1 Tax=Flavobacterium sp. SUN046 TaxID=3002440 RepID=UPI002DB6B6FC|nr:hypothetical protein [Flavobacterium sp. SUN046]MEC4048434.1 hypothetical protein [Flavobacterium sp. SUN046]
MRCCIYIFLFFSSLLNYAQSDFEKVLKSGEVIVNGLSFFINNKSQSISKMIESICVKNELSERITFKMIGKDINGNEQIKELVITKDGKECMFNIQKGVWIYEIISANNEVFKKGEYKLDDTMVILVKDN